MRFDEIELQSVELPDIVETRAPAEPLPRENADASLFRRVLALGTDLSLFLALTIAMSALLPASGGWRPVAALGGFVVMTSYYYFVGAWLLWGKTIGGAIFDVRVIAAAHAAMSLRAASLRWVGVYLSLLTAGAGFAIAALPGRRSLPDRLSGTRCVAAA